MGGGVMIDLDNAAGRDGGRCPRCSHLNLRPEIPGRGVFRYWFNGQEICLTCAVRLDDTVHQRSVTRARGAGTTEA
jgi:hypothetical protein